MKLSTSSCVLHSPSVPGTTGTPASMANCLASVLSPNLFNTEDFGPDERDAVGLTESREVHVLRQEPIARMDGVHIISRATFTISSYPR